ncbi:hypothetical protein GJ496_007669 [Pomphorhynchus laevis]|nr:hypothetical protein GJ496_007669 [Pomphorhynchus laevis]
MIPLDKSKPGRDLDELLRRNFVKTFDKGEDSVVDSKHWQECKTSLEALGSNTFKNQYPPKFNIGVSGIAQEHCRYLLSEDVLKKLNTKSKTRKFF